MRDLISRIVDKTPVPYSSRRAGGVINLGSVGNRDDSLLSKMGQVGTLFAVVDRICTAATAQDWALYRKPTNGKAVNDDERVEVTKHAALDVWNKPNSFYTQNDLIETLQQHYELMGEGFLIVVRAGGIPIELWPVSPERMIHVPNATDFLSGWLYRTPDGEKIPLGLDEVIQVKRPNPQNPYRGLGVIQALLADLDATRYSAEWNRNFFLNSAEPGGIIEMPEGINDTDFEQMQMRWNEQHRGVNRAHRVAIIEHGKYVPRAFTMRDMQFAELRAVSRDTIMEAFGISRATLGITDGVNFAAAKAAKAQFAELLTVPRLERWKQALNFRLLPMFGADGKVEFDYESPAEADEEQEVADRDSKVRAVAALVPIGFDAKATLEAFDLPDIPFEKPAPPVVQMPPTGDTASPAGGDEPPQGGKSEGSSGTPQQEPPTQGKPPAAFRNQDDAPDADLSDHQAAWVKQLEHLLEQWQTISAGQRAELGKQIAAAIDDNNLAALADLSASSKVAGERLHEALTVIARTAAQQASAEAAEQGAHAPATVPDAHHLEGVAVAVTALLAAGLAVSAGREALRRHDGVKSGQQVAGEVKAWLEQQSDAPVKAALGGALSGAQNTARLATFHEGPVGSLYADETLDGNTCGPCAAINGQFLATTEDMAAVDAIYTPAGGYVDCLGGVRCRGTITGVWRPKTTEDS